MLVLVLQWCCCWEVRLTGSLLERVECVEGVDGVAAVAFVELVVDAAVVDFAARMVCWC